MTLTNLHHRRISTVNIVDGEKSKQKFCGYFLGLDWFSLASSRMRRLIVGTGIGATRFAFMPLPGKSLDRDTLNNPHIRDPESGVDRVLMIFDRR